MIVASHFFICQKISKMKKNFTIIACLIFFNTAFSQKNSIEIGVPTFNHFDGYGFKTSEAIQDYPYAIAGLVAESLCLGYERQIDDKNSMSISYNGFYYKYQKALPHNHGLIARNFFNLNLHYKRTFGNLWQNRIFINGQGGLSWRFEGNEAFHLRYDKYYSVNGTLIEEDKDWGAYLLDLGLSLGISARIKVFKGLFANIQSNYTYYLIGEYLRKGKADTTKSTQVLSVALSLGYRF